MSRFPADQLKVEAGLFPHGSDIGERGKGTATS
jgi:hypothetical protein